MKTLLMVKPDVVERGLYPDIISILLHKGFTVTRLEMLSMDHAMAERFYEVHKEREFFPALVDYITSGPVVALEIEGDDVVGRIRQLIGATDPAASSPGTIRHMYGRSIQNNAVHASDSAESAKKELAIVFSGS